MSNWAFSLLPLLGVIIGAMLQFLLSKASERNKRIESLRAEAYADYLRAIAASAHSQSDSDRLAAIRSAADAKTRIVVYGTGSVVRAIAKFERAGATTANKEGVWALTEIVSVMRDSAPDVSPRDIEVLLVGPTD